MPTVPHDFPPGTRFNRWTVRGPAPKRGGAYHWLCVCDCGTTREVNGSKLKTGRIKSCGCYVAEILSARSKTHGMFGTPEYSTWQGMKTRCDNPKSPNYERYGGRGIKVCKRWQDSFTNFYADMGARPVGTSLDRIDNDGPYSPDNCRWATGSQQSRNQSTTKLLTHEGETLSISTWAERTGINRTTIDMRLSRGWSVGRALTEPMQPRK